MFGNKKTKKYIDAGLGRITFQCTHGAKIRSQDLNSTKIRASLGQISAFNFNHKYAPHLQTSSQTIRPKPFNL